MVALDSFNAAKGAQVLRLAVDVPHLDLVVVAARKQPELAVVLEGSDEGLVGLDGFVGEVVLVEELAVIGAEVETAPRVDGGSNAIFGADGDLRSGEGFLLDLRDAGNPDLEILERASNQCGGMVFLFDIDDVALLVDQLGRSAVPILHLTLLDLL